ncbi:MAG TPA: TetR/AcrR family transcriptional regulator [Puia sp.]|nr:TetR/AcrR family transcriptional regulator [Puia sp.]
MENKERILEKAHDLFMQYGIRSITMDEIAAQLGISKKTIYQFFTDKDTMVEAVVNELINQNEEDCRGFSLTAENAVHEIFMAMDFTQEMMKAMNPQIMYDLEKHHPVAFKRLKQYKYQFLFSTIKENLERGAREDIYRTDLNIDLTTRYRIESAFMPFNQEAFPQNKYPMNQTCQELAILFLHSICNPKGKKLIEKYLNERQKNFSNEQKISS